MEATEIAVVILALIMGAIGIAAAIYPSSEKGALPPKPRPFDILASLFWWL